jgi:hypothetical protein
LPKWPGSRPVFLDLQSSQVSCLRTISVAQIHYLRDHRRSTKRREYCPCDRKVAQQRLSNKFGDRLAILSRFGIAVHHLAREMLYSRRWLLN